MPIKIWVNFSRQNEYPLIHRISSIDIYTNLQFNNETMNIQNNLGSSFGFNIFEIPHFVEQLFPGTIEIITKIIDPSGNEICVNGTFSFE